MTIRNKALGLALGAASLAAVAAPQSAEAALLLRYSTDNGANFTTISDDGAGDNAGATLGTISIVVAGVEVVLVAIGSQTFVPAALTLNSTVLSGSLPTLIVEATGTDYLAPDVALSGTVDVGVSALAGSLEYTAWVDDANGEFGKTTQIANRSGNSAATFDEGFDPVALDLTGLYSVTQQYKFTFAGPQQTSSVTATVTVSPVPAPAALSLLGLGLLGLGAAVRRRKA